MDKADGDKVRTKELICKLMVLNQFVVLVPIITKGYGQRGFGQRGFRAGEKARARCDNITVSLTFCWLKVNEYELFS